MNFTNAVCPHCGAELTIDHEKRQAVCQYCGASVFMEEKNDKRAEQAGYFFEKGRQRAQKENWEQAHHSYTAYTNTRTSTGKKGSLLLWILGWLFMFPVPLTILMLRRTENGEKILWAWVLGWILIFPIPATILTVRSQQWSRPFKGAVIAGAWLFYLLIF